MEILELVVEKSLGKSVLARCTGLKARLLQMEQTATASKTSPEQKERIAAIVELCFEYMRENDADERENILRTLDEIVRNQPIELPKQTVEQWDDSLAADDHDYQKLRSADAKKLSGFLKKYFSLKAKTGLRTQMEVAKAGGFGRTQITVLESGEHMPQQKTLQKLAKVFGVDVTELM